MRNQKGEQESYLCARKPPNLSLLKNTLKGVESYNKKIEKPPLKSPDEYELIPEPEESRKLTPNVDFLKNSLKSVQSHNERIQSNPPKEEIERKSKRSAKSPFSSLKSQLEKNVNFNKKVDERIKSKRDHQDSSSSKRPKCQNE